ncbi:MAG: MmgE/PrpD family protein [Sutterella wadsworthensis]
MLREEGEGPGRATLWGRGETMTPVNAALVNGTASHAFELDDTGGCDHSGAVVVPAAVAAVELAGPSRDAARNSSTAVVIGYDIARRPLEACGAC